MNYFAYPYYSESVATSSVRRLSGMRILFELILSINYHKRTVGYEYHGAIVRPVLEEDSEDKWYFEGIDVRRAKRNNDSMAQAFADAVVSTGVYKFSKDIFSHLAVPSLVSFVDRPLKDYLRYLHRFIWCKRPFVGSLWGNKGVWKRGNLFYGLPRFMTKVLCFVLSDAESRRRLNNLLAWKNRK